MSYRLRSRLAAPFALVAALAFVGAGCVSEPTTIVPDSRSCADVVDVVSTSEESGTYRFDVTVRSADTGWDKYADLWEVRAPDGTVLGQRVLAHPHVDEQPFTRSQSGIEIPAGIDRVTVAARDTVAGFCGETIRVNLP